jgi:ribonuclease P protein component
VNDPAPNPAHKTPRATFGRAKRLTKDDEYAAVFAGKIRCTRGCLTIHALPNALRTHRLGLSVGKRVGSAVVRNRLKRRLREAFRLSRHDLPCARGRCLDIIISARPHAPLTTREYAQLLLEAAGRCARAWEGRGDDPS